MQNHALRFVYKFHFSHFFYLVSLWRGRTKLVLIYNYPLGLAQEFHIICHVCLMSLRSGRTEVDIFGFDAEYGIYALYTRQF